jgi:YegS/Rv2252/BmrU family lipid kinase
MSKYCLVYNPRSGNRNFLNELEELLVKHGIEAETIKLSRGWRKKVQNQINEDCQVLIAAGGDGTVREVAEVAANKDLSLAVLPLGTFNHFAKDLNIPMQVEEALELIKNGKAVAVDTASVNNYLFLNNSAVGLYPQLVSQRPQAGGAFRKLVASVVSAFKILVDLKSYRVKISLDKRPVQESRASFIFVGNNEYQPSQIGFSNRTSLQAGVLSLYQLKTSKTLKIIWAFMKALLGRAGPKDNFGHQTAQDIRIDFRRSSARVSLDGELKKLKTPLHYQIRPKSLKVFQLR